MGTVTQTSSTSLPRARMIAVTQNTRTRPTARVPEWDLR